MGIAPPDQHLARRMQDHVFFSDPQIAHTLEMRRNQGVHGERSKRAHPRLTHDAPDDIGVPDGI
jgi:hypothetical protein